jgi:nucleoside-diphosphate-sugar epimerase
VKLLIEISGRDVEPEIRGTDLEGELDRQFLDASAIREELDWTPKWDMESGLRAAYAWYERTLR